MLSNRIKLVKVAKNIVGLSYEITLSILNVLAAVDADICCTMFLCYGAKR